MVLSMERWKGKVAIVTGAGGGLGSEIVKKLLGEDLQVVALDLRPEFLEKLSNEVSNNSNLHTFALDITYEEEVVKILARITVEIGPVHILVNCAGILQHTNLTNGDTQKWKKVFDLNVIALSVMTREAVKVMKAHNIDGHIVNLCSLAGHKVSNSIVAVDLNVYPASKFAVRALSETLRQEFNHLGLKIKITNVSPGFVATGLIENCNFEFREQSKGIMSTTPMLKAVDVTDGILYALSTPPHVQVHELTMQAVGETF